MTRDDFLWKVFISHSSKDTDGVAAKLRDKLAAALRKPAYDVFLDRDALMASDNWKERLRQEIRDAHIGIVLLDRAATDAHWVQRETAGLIMKEHADLRIFPVYIGIDRKHIRTEAKFFEPLNDFNTVLLTEPEEQAAKEVEACRGLAEILQLLQGFPPVERGEVFLIKFLARQFGENEQLVRDVRDHHFGQPDRSRYLPFQVKEKLAKDLIDARIDSHAVRAVKALADQINVRRGYFLQAFEPTWLTFRQAGSLRVTRGNSAVRSFVLHTDWEENGRQYVRRANYCDESAFEIEEFPPWADGETTSMSNDIDDLFERLDCAHPDGGPCDAGSEVQYVVVPGFEAPTLSVTFANAIHRRCPEVVVLVLLPPGQLDQAELTRLFDGGFGDVGPVAHTTYVKAQKNLRKIRERLYVQ